MFDETKANRAIKFISNLKHTKGQWAGQYIKLLPFQEKIIKDIFGTVDKKGLRQYRTVYIEIPRKNGKSTLCAAIALYLLFAEGEAGAEIYSAAGDRDQAGIVYQEAMRMIEQSTELMKRCKIIQSTKRVILNRDHSFYRVLSSESKTKHGFNASGIIFDEVHTQPNRDLWDVLSTSVGSRRQPLIIAITTAGFNKNSICYELHQYADKILRGVIKDKTFYPVLYCADEKEDWTDEKIWMKYNPALNIFRNLDEMKAMCKKAQEIPSEQNTFKRLYLNIWTRQETKWLDYQKWVEASIEINSDDLRGKECYAGLDLSSTMDLTAFVLVFPLKDCYKILPFFWMPEDNLQIRAQQDQMYIYNSWRDQGLLDITQGNVIDYREIRNKIKSLSEVYNIREIAFDKWGATELIQNLTDDGFCMIPFAQNFSSYTAPTRELMKLVNEKKLHHGNNPILNWMADNMIVKQDLNGNIRPDKSKSVNKIDGMVALIMGLDRSIRHQTSVYEERGILMI